MNTKDIDSKNSVRMPRDERETYSSPDATECSICLSDIEPQARSVISICFHEFCFSCIGKWSKENAVCPLCKQNFTEILHNIRSDADYDACYITRHVLKAKRRLNRRRDGAATSLGEPRVNYLPPNNSFFNNSSSNNSRFSSVFYNSSNNIRSTNIKDIVSKASQSFGNFGRSLARFTKDIVNTAFSNIRNNNQSTSTNNTCSGSCMKVNNSNNIYIIRNRSSNFRTDSNYNVNNSVQINVPGSSNIHVRTSSNINNNNINNNKSNNNSRYNGNNNNNQSTSTSFTFTNINNNNNNRSMSTNIFLDGSGAEFRLLGNSNVQVSINGRNVISGSGNMNGTTSSSASGPTFSSSDSSTRTNNRRTQQNFANASEEAN